MEQYSVAIKERLHSIKQSSRIANLSIVKKIYLTAILTIVLAFVLSAFGIVLPILSNTASQVIAWTTLYVIARTCIRVVKRLKAMVNQG